MPTPHKHAEVIKAWADGQKVEVLSITEGWIDPVSPQWSIWDEYRVKPAAPKWPQTTMTEEELAAQVSYVIQPYPGQNTGPFYASVANAALAHACETGLVVPIEVHDEKIKAEASQWLAALQSAAKRERELGDMLYEAVLAVHELDPHRKVRMPVPKPTILVK